MAKTYELICPNCGDGLTAEFEPGEIEETESIACPDCEDEFVFVHDATADTITLGESIYEDADEESEEEDADDGVTDLDEDEGSDEE